MDHCIERAAFSQPREPFQDLYEKGLASSLHNELCDSQRLLKHCEMAGWQRDRGGVHPLRQPLLQTSSDHPILSGDDEPCGFGSPRGHHRGCCKWGPGWTYSCARTLALSMRSHASRHIAERRTRPHCEAAVRIASIFASRSRATLRASLFPYGAR